jgi:hypothetical protein
VVETACVPLKISSADASDLCCAKRIKQAFHSKLPVSSIMLDLKARLRRYATTPPDRLWRGALRRIGTSIKRGVARLGDRHCSSYALGKELRPLFHHLENFPLREARACSKSLSAITEHYLAHRFDLLGSGWTRVHHGIECRGVEGHRYDEPAAHNPPIANRINPANRPESSRLASLLEGEYTPIDWQIDFKSGFRWRENCWYTDIAIHTNFPGVDIKVPWELARCQHMPQLALAYGLANAGEPGFRNCIEYQREFRSQVIDFISNNPPRFGVNWSCAMDIGIRVANWLMAYDLFAAAGARFDGAFEAALSRSVYEHGMHIAGNLEWNDAFRSNHYLANLTGLLFAGAYLSPDAKTNGWIHIAAVEMLTEIPDQFTEDGANFEGSTCYHRLSAELVVYFTALLLSVLHRRLPLPWQVSATRRSGAPIRWINEAHLFPHHITNIVERAAEFTMHATKKDGRVAQIGDNDSGRLFKLQPAFQVMPVQQARLRYDNLSNYDGLPADADYWLEVGLDHRHIVGAIGTLFGREDLTDFAGPFALDAATVRMLARERRFQSYRSATEPMRGSTIRIATDDEFTRIEDRLRQTRDTCIQRYRFSLGEALHSDSTSLFAYPEFGLYFIKARDLYLAIRCGPHGQAGIGGHNHNDQLSVELVANNGHAYALDPGTYLYTASPSRRNEYRSVAAHFAPRASDTEPCSLSQLFSLPDTTHATCLYFGSLGFIGTHKGYRYPVYRVVALERDHIEIRDYAAGLMLEPCRFSGTDCENIRFNSPPFSAGYGMRMHDSKDI